MPKVRVHNLAVSIDGYMAGPNQSLDNPLGVGGPGLHEWVFATRTGREMPGTDGGDEVLDDEFVARGDQGIGATIMGRNMFGPIRGPWTDHEWTGWWGDDPPYHHPSAPHSGAMRARFGDLRDRPATHSPLRPALRDRCRGIRGAGRADAPWRYRWRVARRRQA